MIKEKLHRHSLLQIVREIESGQTVVTRQPRRNYSHNIQLNRLIDEMARAQYNHSIWNLLERLTVKIPANELKPKASAMPREECSDEVVIEFNQTFCDLALVVSQGFVIWLLENDYGCGFRCTEENFEVMLDYLERGRPALKNFNYRPELAFHSFNVLDVYKAFMMFSFGHEISHHALHHTGHGHSLLNPSLLWRNHLYYVKNFSHLNLNPRHTEEFQADWFGKKMLTELGEPEDFLHTLNATCGFYLPKFLCCFASWGREYSPGERAGFQRQLCIADTVSSNPEIFHRRSTRALSSRDVIKGEELFARYVTRKRGLNLNCQATELMVLVSYLKQYKECGLEVRNSRWG